MFWKWGAEVKALPGALGSLRPVHRKSPSVQRRRDGRREKALQGERVLAERPGMGEEGEGGVTGQPAFKWLGQDQGWADHPHLSVNLSWRGSQASVLHPSR